MQNLKVTYKIMILIVTGFLGLSIVGGWAYSGLREAEEVSDILYHKYTRTLVDISTCAEKMRTIRVRSLQAIVAPEQAAELKKLQTEDIAAMDAAIAEYMKVNSDGAEEIALAERVSKEWATFKVAMPKVIDLAAAGDLEAAKQEYRSCENIINSLRDELNTANEKATTDVEKISLQTIEDAQTIIASTTTIIVICLIALFIASTVIIKQIKTPLEQMKAMCEKFKEGDFNVSHFEVPTRGDEFGDAERALLEMAKAVNKFLNEVSHSTEQIASASEQLTASSMQTAEAATTVAQSVAQAAEIGMAQLQSVDQGNQSVAHITNSVEEISRESTEAARFSTDAANKADQGGHAVAHSVEQIRSVEATVRSTADLVDKLGERSQEIGTIVDAISDLAGQTNLLALNAAIEAARAGEQGRGFAVVAEEVRKLAEQSASAAQQIATLISAIQEDTNRAVASMDAGRNAVDEGARSVDNLRDVFSEIQGIVSDVSGRVKDMSKSVEAVARDAGGITHEMADIESGSRRVNDEMQAVSAATEQQSASAEEIAAASDALSKLAQELQNVLARFKF